jgi:hypothetical protein
MITLKSRVCHMLGLRAPEYQRAGDPNKGAIIPPGLCDAPRMERVDPMHKVLSRTVGCCTEGARTYWPMWSDNLTMGGGRGGIIRRLSRPVGTGHPVRPPADGFATRIGAHLGRALELVSVKS